MSQSQIPLKQAPIVLVGDLLQGPTAPRPRPYWMKPPYAGKPADVIPLNRFEPWEAPAEGLLGPLIGTAFGAAAMILLAPSESACEPTVEACAPGYKP
jgi:hypothetical protein